MKNNAKKTPKVLILVVALVALIILGAVGVWALLGSEPKVEEVPTKDVYEYVNPDESKAQPDEGFTIDGVLDEKEYLKNKWLYLHNDDGGNNVDIAMTSYYGEKGMYFVYDVTESVPIYVNLDRASYLNSCIEMYFAPSTVTTLSGNSVFEVDLLPTGDMVFKQANGKGGYVGVATTDDKMAYLGATTKGGEVNTENCYGYCLELFIPWDYMQWLGMDVEAMKDSFVYVDPAHITSNNYGGTDTSVDRYWYYYAQQHGASFGNVYQYFRFDANGAQGTVATHLTEGDHYTITGDPYVIPGMLTTVTITPEQGYALNSVLVNGQEYIQKVSYNEDGSVTLNVRGEKGGLTVSAGTEQVTEGNKTLRGTISLHNIGWDSLDGALISYSGPQGEKPLEVDGSGKFQLTDLKQDYYTINVEKTGYQTVSHGIYLNRDAETEISVEFETFYSESGSCWVLDDQNDGIIRKFGGQGFVLTNAAYDDFTFEANFKYVEALNEEKTTTSHFTEQRMGMRIRFSNGKYWNINLLKQNGEYILQYAARSGSVFTKYKHIHTLSDEQIAKYTSDEGIALRVVRDGQYASVYLDGELLAVEDLGKEYKDCTAQLGFEAWVANREIMDIPFTITGKALADVQNSCFYKPNGWVITGQYEGKLYVEGSEKSNWLNFGKKYVNMDLTLNAKDYIGNGTPVRLVAAMNFDNGKNATFSITYADGEYKLQAMGDSIFGWRKFYKLTDEEIAKFQSEEGIDLRIVRIGTEVSLYLDGKEVSSGLDLTGKESGVTADMPATVAIRHYGNVGHTVEIPFAMTEEMNIGTVTVVDSKNGGITVNKYSYMIGDTIYLSDAGEDGYYCTGMKVNGETVPMHWDGTYSFKTSEKEYTVEGTFDKAVFRNQSNWDLMEQNKGIITRHDGVGEGWLEMIGTHVDLDITMTLKGIDETSAAGVRFVFKNDTVDEWATFRIVNEGGKWKLKSMNDSVFNWATFHELTAQQVEKYLSDDGIDFRVVRKGTDVYLYLDGERVCDTIDLTVDDNGEKTGITADMEAVVRIRHYGTTGEDIDIPFAITDKVGTVTIKSEKSENGNVGTQYRSYLLGDSITLVGKGKDHYYCTAMTLNGKAVELAYNGTYTFAAEKKEYTVGGTFAEGTFVYDSESGWDIRNQNEGVVALPNGGNGGWLEFCKKYTDVDITLNVQDYADGEKDPRTELLFAFDTDGDGVYTDAYVTYGVLSEAKNNKAFIQSIPVKNLGTGVYADKYPNHGDLTADEYAAFIDGGVALRVVRSGTDVHLYIGDRKVNVKNLTENETGIKADTKMVVYIRHYDDTGVTVEIPFQVTDKVQTVKVTAESCENGTIVTQFPKYLKNDTVVFFGEGKDHYYCNAMTVNGDAVTQHWNGTYSIKATEDSYTVSGDFVPGIFAYNDGWDLLKQNEGKITVKYTNANGNSNWLDFYDKYTDMDVTLNVREYADDVKGALTRSAIRFTFDNGEIITFSIAKNSGNKYTVQALSGDTIVDKSYDFYVMDAEDIAALNSENGIDFRVVKEGTEVDIYFGSVKVVEDFDLTNGDSGVTADMQAKVSIRRFDDPDIDAEYTVKVSEDVPADDEVTVSIDDAQNGTVTTKWNSHIVGETVILVVTPDDGYYCKSLTVTKDGAPAQLNEVLNIDGGEHTFTAQEGTYSVSAVFAKKVFVTNSGWNLLQQSTGMVAIPGGGNGGWLEFIDKYTDMDVTITARDYASGTGNPRTELLLVFDNGAHVSFGITCDSTHAWIQSLNQAADDGKQIYNRYKGHGELTAEEYADFVSGGVDFRMVRKGTDIHLYIGDRKVNVLSLTNNNSGVTADTAMTVYIRHYDDSGVRVEIPFEVSSTAPDAVDVTVNATNNGEFNTHVSKYLKGDYVVVIPAAADSYACSGLSVNGNAVDKLDWDGTHTFHATEDSYTVSGSFAKKLFADHDNWNTVNQHFGVIANKVTKNTGYVATVGNYNQIAMMLKNPTGSSSFSVAAQFSFETGEIVNVQLCKWNGNYYIKSVKSIFGESQDFYRFAADSDLGKKLESDGVELKIVRAGTNLLIYIDGQRVVDDRFRNNNYIDLTIGKDNAPTQIEATTPATVEICSWCAEIIEIPFVLQTEQPAHSVVTIPATANGTVTADKKVYLPGETVTLTVTPAEGYYNKSVAVKNGSADVTLNGTFNIDGGSYTFTAGEGTNTYTVSAEFAKKVFVTNSKFDLVDQDESMIFNKITSNTGYISTIEDYNQFTITLHDPDGDDADTIGDMGTFQFAGQFNFDLGNDTHKIVNIQVTRWKGTYYIKSANGGSIFGNNMEYCRIDPNNAWYSKITGDGVKLTVARVGTDLVFYLSDGTVTERLNVKYKISNTEYVSDCLDMTKDMSGNDTGITKNAPAKVEFCSWYSEIKQIPFTLVEEQPAYSTVTVTATTNGTVTADKKVYLPGETVTLTVTPAEGYYNKSVAVKNGSADVTLDGTFNIDGGSYTFTAGEGNNTYTVSAEFAKKVFVTNSKFDLTNQDAGTISVEQTVDTGYMATLNSYSSVAVTLRNTDSTQEFSAALRLYFEGNVTDNGNLSVQVWGKNGSYVIKSCHGPSIFGNGNEYYEFSSAEANKLEDGGIELKVAKVGTRVVLFLDGVRLDELNVRGETVDSLDLTVDYNGAATGVTSDAKAIVNVRCWNKRSAADTLEIPFKLEEAQIAYSTVTIPTMTNGTVTADKKVYLPGETVTLTVTPDSGYYHNLKLNDEFIVLDWDDTESPYTYTFTAKEGTNTYKITGTFDPAVITRTSTNHWKLMNQNVGYLYVPKHSADLSAGWLDGVVNTNDVSMLVKDTDAYPIDAPQKGEFSLMYLFKFSNNQAFSVRIHNTDNDGKYKVQTAASGSTLYGTWKWGYTFNEEQTEKIIGDGIEYRVVILGTTAYVYLDGDQVCTFDLSKVVSTGAASGIENATATVTYKLDGCRNGEFAIKYSMSTISQLP